MGTLATLAVVETILAIVGWLHPAIIPAWMYAIMTIAFWVIGAIFILIIVFFVILIIVAALIS